MLQGELAGQKLKTSLQAPYIGGEPGYQRGNVCSQQTLKKKLLALLLVCVWWQMTTELQAHSKTLQDQTVSTARDIAILNDKDHEYAKQGQAKTKEVMASSSNDGEGGHSSTPKLGYTV